jgi:hypothetical protein
MMNVAVEALVNNKLGAMQLVTPTVLFIILLVASVDPTERAKKVVKLYFHKYKKLKVALQILELPQRIITGGAAMLDPTRA